MLVGHSTTHVLKCQWGIYRWERAAWDRAGRAGRGGEGGAGSGRPGEVGRGPGHRVARGEALGFPGGRAEPHRGGSRLEAAAQWTTPPELCARLRYKSRWGWGYPLGFKSPFKCFGLQLLSFSMRSLKFCFNDKKMVTLLLAP